MVLLVGQIHRFRFKANTSGSNDPTGGSTSPMRAQREELRLELTDGWYSVPAVLDGHLEAFVEEEKIKIGSKLLVAGAELVGSEDGVDPLDASYVPSRSNCPVALKLTINATRPAKWDAKLGFVKPTQTIQSQDGLLLVKSLADVVPGGGSVPLMDLIIFRRFPLLYLEKGSDSNSSTILTEAQEEKRRRQFEQKRNREIEMISDAAEKDCAKLVDEQAPEQWTKMMSSSAMCDYYEGLSKEDKLIVDRWEERRNSMITDMTRRVVDAKMQSNPSLTRSSISFLRITVKALQNQQPHMDNINDEDDAVGIPNHPSATLTVWRMSEDQSNALKEGSVVRIKDLGVKSELRDDMLQFSANDKTRIQLLPKQPSSRQLQLSGFTKRAFAPIVRAHVLSRKAAVDRKAGDGVHIDFAGVLVRSELEQQGMPYTSCAYFTDESGLLLRLQRDIGTGDDSAFSGWSKILEEDEVLAFKDALVLPFDGTANCAVVSWSQPTVREKAFNSPRVRSLQKWAESDDAQRTFATVLASLDTGLPLYTRLPQRTEIAIGYVLAIRSRYTDTGEFGGQYSNISSDHFEVDIDAGSGSNLVCATCSRAVLSQTIELHMDRTETGGNVLDVKDLLQQRNGVVLAENHLNSLNSLFIESGILFQVMLRLRRVSGLGYQNDLPEVLQMTPANTKALSTLYLVALKP